jgi:hypothetical protein
MKVLLFTASFCTIILLAGCGLNENKPNVMELTWTSLKISPTQGTNITIFYDHYEGGDSSMVTIYDPGSIFSPRPKGKLKIDTLWVKFTKAERDTLGLIANNLISNPAPPKQFCTEFVGKLAIEIRYGEQVKRSVEYNSVCDWSALSLEAKQLNKMLVRKQISRQRLTSHVTINK